MARKGERKKRITTMTNRSRKRSRKRRNTKKRRRARRSTTKRRKRSTKKRRKKLTVWLQGWRKRRHEHHWLTRGSILSYQETRYDPPMSTTRTTLKKITRTCPDWGHGR